MPERGKPAAVAAFIGVAFGRSDGVLRTDSTSAYEAVALAEHFDSFRLHGFQAAATVVGRDPLPAPPALSFVSLGTVRRGLDLYGSFPRIALRILRACRTDPWEAAIVFETGPVPLVALVCCAITRRPAVAAIRGDSARTAAAAHRYRTGWRRGIGLGLAGVHGLTQWAMARTVPVIVDSEEMARRIRSWGGRARVIPAASVSARDVLLGRRYWTGPAERPLRLLWVGRFERIKGLEDLIRAVAHLVTSGYEVELELVGGGDPSYREGILALVRRLELDERVAFTGPIPHGHALYERYSRADLFVLPSLSEGTPKVIGEAFAHGLPVVATSVGDLPRLIGPGLGTLVSPGDPNALGGAVGAYADDPARIRCDAERCLAAANSLTVEATTSRLAAAVAEATPPRWRWRAMRR